MRIRLLPAVILAVSLVLAACGGDEPGADSCEVKVTGAADAKPTVTVPECDPPTTLVSKDLGAGSGAALTAGQTATVHYVGISWSTRQQFDSSWDRGQPYPVENVGQAQVIQGWNEGLIGMKAGGRRLLVIPPELGYGAQANGPIAANETLVFVVDVTAIK